MGLIRLLLAIAVIINHSGPIFGFTLLRGNIAVQSFYLISGFYMAMVLETKYFKLKKPYKLFLFNRILRIFPLYWTILLLSLSICLISYFTASKELYLHEYIKHAPNLGLTSWFYLISSQIVLFGQDLIMFLGVNTGTGQLYFTSYLYFTDPVLFHFMLVPPAWTLGLELSFYLLAPFLLRLKNVWLILIILLSLIIRVYALQTGYFRDPYIYWFFPMELGMFLSGSIVYRLSRKIPESWLRHSGKLLILVLLLTASFSILDVHLLIKTISFFALICLFLPFGFHLSQKSKLDQLAGDLSYPAYLSNHLIITAIIPLFPFSEKYSSIVAISITLLFSWFLLQFITKPIDNYRHNKFRGNIQ
jgi:peptidoglycan/LPS O-acetylase OafA/YrhL